MCRFLTAVCKKLTSVFMRKGFPLKDRGKTWFNGNVKLCIPCLCVFFYSGTFTLSQKLCSCHVPPPVPLKTSTCGSLKQKYSIEGIIYDTQKTTEVTQRSEGALKPQDFSPRSFVPHLSWPTV